MKQRITLLIALILVFVTGFVSTPIVAEEAYNEFSISANLPENQLNKEVSYFDLRVVPNQVQDLQVNINNTGSQVMTASVEVNAARTGNNGVKIYTDKGAIDSSMQYPIDSIVEVITPQIVVQPNSSAVATIRIHLPDTEISGVVLGGIVVKATMDGEHQNSGKEAFDIKNQVAYALGLKLSMNDEAIAPNLNLMKVQAALTDYHPTVTAQIQNDKPIIMNGVKISGEVYDKGSSKERSKVEITNGEISPNTNFDVVFDWQDKKVEAGSYRIHLRAEYEGKVWEWNENFTVKDKEAKKVNEKAMFTKDDNNWTWIIVGGIIAVLLIIVGILVFLLVKRNKERK